MWRRVAVRARCQIRRGVPTLLLELVDIRSIFEDCAPPMVMLRRPVVGKLFVLRRRLKALAADIAVAPSPPPSLRNLLPKAARPPPRNCASCTFFVCSPSIPHLSQTSASNVEFADWYSWSRRRRISDLRSICFRNPGGGASLMLLAWLCDDGVASIPTGPAADEEHCRGVVRKCDRAFAFRQRPFGLMVTSGFMRSSTLVSPSPSLACNCSSTSDTMSSSVALLLLQPAAATVADEQRACMLDASAVGWTVVRSLIADRAFELKHDIARRLGGSSSAAAAAASLRPAGSTGMPSVLQSCSEPSGIDRSFTHDPGWSNESVKNCASSTASTNSARQLCRASLPHDLVDVANGSASPMPKSTSSTPSRTHRGKPFCSTHRPEGARPSQLQS
mmetsp:Transcript_50089/g.144282  ORF Transcript_50089/g.144282 Transcript_50089/m.144282 type:complete len:390 (+) Transcript_50089:115-1284(+)